VPPRSSDGSSSDPAGDPSDRSAPGDLPGHPGVDLHLGAATLESEAFGTGPGSAGHGGHTILVVDDNPVVRGLMVRVLGEHGYEVLEASNGELALSIAAAHSGRIDLLLTDVLMPGMSGAELAVELETVRPGVPRVFVSGYPEGEILRSGMLDPGVTFVQKPFVAAALLQRVREALAAARA